MVNTGLHCSAPSYTLIECECGDACSHRNNAFIELQLFLRVYLRLRATLKRTFGKKKKDQMHAQPVEGSLKLILLQTVRCMRNLTTQLSSL